VAYSTAIDDGKDVTDIDKIQFAIFEESMRIFSWKTFRISFCKRKNIY
jgi:hypothetical protein